jgi:hypothetical protein
MSWRLTRLGKADLVCDVKGHLVCTSPCDNAECDDDDNGHCFRCGALIRCILNDQNDAGVEAFTDNPEEYECPRQPPTST